jgi:membrane protein implicated in regulation of membrane protease activity
MSPAVIWLIVGLVLIAAEVLSGEFVLLMLGGGALVAGGASLLGGGPLVSVAAFVIASVLLVFAVRPALRRKLERGIDQTVMHSRALVGGPAIVVARVDGQNGRVKIGGDVWSARSYDGSQVIDEGRRVTVVEISGATALVVADD